MEKNMELEEAIKELKGILNHTKIANECGVATRGEYHKEKEAIEVILNHLTTQEKMIELMIQWVDDRDYTAEFCESKTECDEHCRSCVKQYFEKKVGESE